jgi:hypothetical protein
MDRLIEEWQMTNDFEHVVGRRLRPRAMPRGCYTCDQRR